MVKKEKRIKPKYNKKLPPKKNVKYFFTPASDEAFKANHPKAYVLLCIVGIFALLFPMMALLAYTCFIHPAPNSGFLVLTMVGAFIIGIGLFNIVAAWIKQYLGHTVTAVCLILGSAMVAISMIIMYVPQVFDWFDEEMVTFYFVQLLFCLIPFFYYAGFRAGFWNWMRRSRKISNSTRKKLTKGMKNYWFYESLHKNYELGGRYVINKIFLIGTLASLGLSLFVGWCRPLLPFTTGVFSLTLLMCSVTAPFSSAEENRSMFGASFVLFRIQNRRVHSVLIDAAVAVFPLILICSILKRLPDLQ